ncbi:MAG: type III-B CRISPR module RAMP protein Cmr6 [Peptococcaceae bacterium]|nr:type III-B CRISPR module RAMP protein Cmr6 [Peptococcaceae bacterium]
MSLPLYKGYIIKDFPRYNAGLWYNKFCDLWDDQWQLDGKGKKKWIDLLAGKEAGWGELLSSAVRRHIGLLGSCGGKLACYETGSRFVTGLGLQHPVENGFAWHPTLGVPYIPGSSVKGVVRDWVVQWEKRDKSEIDRIFGPEPKEGKEEDKRAAGSIIFFDALPVRPVKLEADVITPHYGPYYKDKNIPPADWHSPNPIPFLTVSRGQVFLFSVAQRKENERDDCSLAMQWLREALEWPGAGGKTALGYGRFVLHRGETDKLEKRMASVKAHTF